MTPLPLIAYRLATRALEPLAPRLLDARARRGKEDPVRVDERMGFTRSVTIYDSAVSERLKKAIIKDMEQDDKTVTPVSYTPLTLPTRLLV